jgi:dynein light chain 1
MNANTVSEWQEFELLQTLPNLQELTFAGNPLEVATGENWRIEVLKRLPNLKKLEGVDVTEQELSQARRQTEKKVQFVPKDENSENEQHK